MYLLSVAAKMCTFCSKSWKNNDKARHISEVSRMLDESFVGAEYDYDNEKITYEEFQWIEKIVLECKLLCYDCDGKCPKIHEKVDKDLVQIIKEEIEKIRITREKEEEAVGATGKPSNIYFISNFQKKVVSGR